jgi:hypothetical protein
MHENIVYPANEISAVRFIRLACLLWAQAVKEVDLAQHYGVGSLEKVLTNPVENSARLKEALGTGGNHGTSARYWTVPRLLI